MTRIIAYRHAAYDSPLWAFPSSRSGRFHRGRADTVQYLCLHPLGPAAEMLRHNVGPGGDPDQVLLNIWATQVDIDGAISVSFDECETHNISPDELVGDPFAPTQELADRLRRTGATGMIVPSAALPGTDNLVLFGARVIHPYASEVWNSVEIPTGHLTDGGRPPQEILPFVRWIGTPHRALEHWKRTGVYEPLTDPLAARW